MDEIELSPDIMEIKEFKLALVNKKNQSGNLIPLLQAAQNSYGYIPEKVIYCISELINIPTADIYGVITFYAQFRLKPLGKNVIRICEGTACHVNGAKSILGVLQEEMGINVDETTGDGMFSLQSVACIGCCSLAPVIMINEDTHGNLTIDKIRKLIKTYKKNENSQTSKPD